MRIDAHQHFWQYKPGEYGWMGSNMDKLRRDHLPDYMVPLLSPASIDGVVAVEARQTLRETAWLLSLADRYSFIKGVVGWVDLCSARIRGQLETYSTHTRLCGVRHVLHDEPDDYLMLREEFIRGIEMLTQFDLAYDLVLFPQHLPIACELVGHFT